MTVEASTSPLRPYVACAVLKGVTFDKRRYKSFIDLQEKLHQNICRKRTYVAIGTHDLDTVNGPFRYVAKTPEDISFVPLTEDNGKVYNGKELLNYYREDPLVKHLKPYTDIIYSSPVYPVIYDKDDNVLSLPPIINSKKSRITLDTKNIFIECTGTDLTKVNIVLDTMITMFSEYCETPFTAEKVKVIYEESKTEQVTPLLSTRVCETKLKDIKSYMGVDVEIEKICQLCDRMQLGPSKYNEDRGTISVTVPPSRSDILHPVDVIEDVAIAYGYNNLPIEVPKTNSFGRALPINAFSDLLRNEISRAGYMEMLTHGLCSTAENFTGLQREVGPAVSLSNPANVEYEVVRTTLIPGALKTLAYNKSMSHKDGVKLFEISDVVIPVQNEIGAKNVRHLVALYASYTSSFEVIHGLVDKIMTWTQILPEKTYALNSLTNEEYKDLQKISRSNLHYTVKMNTTDKLFFDGMGADVILRYTKEGNDQEIEKEVVVGSLGVLHPKVLENFEVSYPCTVVELNLELLM